MNPIIFEECYCIDSDPTFVEKVKSTNEISETKIMESLDEVPAQQSEPAFVGVHLFVM